MPSLIDELARRLDTSPDQARRRLRTLLNALRSRTERNDEASLRGLGTFSRENDTWAFDPDEALARSINHSFDDLDPVGVSASSIPEDADRTGADDSAEASSSPAEKPTSIFDRIDAPPAEGDAPSARGVFAPEASSEETTPKDASPESGEEPPAEASGTSEGDSLEEQPDEPAPEEASSPPAADASYTPDSGARSSSSRSSAPASPQDESTTSDWAFPGPSSPAASEEHAPAWSYAALPAGYLVHRRAASPSGGDLRAGRLRAAATTEAAPARETAAGPRRTADRPGAEPSPAQKAHESTAAPASAGRERSEASGGGSSSSGLLGWLAALVVLLALGLGVWYVLAPQGDSGGGSRRADSNASTVSPPSNAASGNRAGAARADSSAQDAAAAPSDSARAYPQAERFDRAHGGWTVVVASETSRDTARRVAERFARRFQNQNYPIDILETTVDGTSRYRVVIGQFSSRDEASGTLEQDADRFPQDAWNLQVEPAS